jgi:YggT family protein
MTTIKFFVIFLLGLALDFYLLLLLLRFLLQILKANFYNPISHFILNMTGFVKSLQKIMRPYRGFDYGLLLVIFIIEFIKVLLLFWIRFDNLPVILGWIGSNFENPFYEITYILTEFLLRPIRRFVPIIAGLDFSPLIVAIALKAFAIIAIVPLIRWGQIIATQGLL